MARWASKLLASVIDVESDLKPLHSAAELLSLFSLSEKYLPATKDLKRRCVECIRSRVGDVTEGGTFTELCAHPVLMRELFCSMVSSQRPRGDAEKPEGTAAKRPRTGA